MIVIKPRWPMHLTIRCRPTPELRQPALFRALLIEQRGARGAHVIPHRLVVARPERLVVVERTA